MKSVFVSYKHEDKKQKDIVEKWAKEGRFGDNVVVTGESKDVRHHGGKAIKNHLSPKLRGASTVVVLVGDDTHNSSGVAYEVQHAKSQNKKIITVRIPDTKGGNPASLKDSDLVAFEPNAIKKAIE